LIVRNSLLLSRKCKEVLASSYSHAKVRYVIGKKYESKITSRI
jgi:hypothetical protein